MLRGVGGWEGKKKCFFQKSSLNSVYLTLFRDDFFPDIRILSYFCRKKSNRKINIHHYKIACNYCFGDSSFPILYLSLITWFDCRFRSSVWLLRTHLFLFKLFFQFLIIYITSRKLLITLYYSYWIQINKRKRNKWKNTNSLATSSSHGFSFIVDNFSIHSSWLLYI